MELLSLFLVFMKIGFTSFGGMSMVPVINEEMLSHGWMSTTDVSNIVAIAEMTPGPLGINCATFAGIQVAGIIGGIVAVLGVLMPAFTTTLLVAVFYQKFKSTSFMSYILYVIRPVCIGLMLTVIYTMILSCYWPENTSTYSISTMDISCIVIGLIALGLLLSKKVGVIGVICLSAVLGLISGIAF